MVGEVRRNFLLPQIFVWIVISKIHFLESPIFVVRVQGQLLPLRIQHNNALTILVISNVLHHADGGSHRSWLQSKYKTTSSWLYNLNARIILRSICTNQSEIHSTNASDQIGYECSNLQT